MTADAILADLAVGLSNFHGREYSGEITRETLFFADLGLASIDAVVLAEELEKKYGRRFPFHVLLGRLKSRALDDLPMGELADFLAAELAGG